MTNTSAVSQPPIAAGEAVGGRARQASRKAGNGEDGGFPGLLSSLAAGRHDRPGKPGKDAPATEKTHSPDTQRRRMAGWFGGNGEALAGEAAGDAQQALAGEAGAIDEMQAGNEDGGATLPAADQAGILGQGTGSNDVAISANGVAALAAAAAGGGPADADAAPAQANSAGGGAPQLPDDLIAGDLANGVARANAQEGEGVEVTATVAILGRETHLAPVREAAAVVAPMQGDPHADSGAQSGTDEAGAPARAGTGPASGAAAPTAVPHLAVTAPRGSDAGAQQRQGGGPFSARQSATDAPSGGADASADARTSAEQAAPAARSDTNASATSAAATPVQQIATRITSEVGAAVQAGRPEAAGFVSQPQLGSAVKVLHIQLQPADLGTVTVRLSLKDQALRLDLEVGRGETAHLIQRDREALSALLRSAGYLVDGLDVRVADPSGPGQQSAGGQPNMQTPGQGQSGSSQADARPQGARAQDQRRGNPFGNERNGEDQQAGHPARRSDIYV
jgi:chemotaxis protein MotD